jgi:hypothetical protein
MSAPPGFDYSAGGSMLPDVKAPIHVQGGGGMIGGTYGNFTLLKNLFPNLKSSSIGEWRKYDTLGEGDCLIHAIDQSIDEDYKKLKTDSERQQYVENQRVQLAKSPQISRKKEMGTIHTWLEDKDIDDLIKHYQANGKNIVAVIFDPNIAKSEGVNNPYGILLCLGNIIFKNISNEQDVIFIHGNGGHYSSISDNNGIFIRKYKDIKIFPEFFNTLDKGTNDEGLPSPGKDTIQPLPSSKPKSPKPIKLNDEEILKTYGLNKGGVISDNIDEKTKNAFIEQIKSGICSSDSGDLTILKKDCWAVVAVIREHIHHNLKKEVAPQSAPSPAPPPPPAPPAPPAPPVPPPVPPPTGGRKTLKQSRKKKHINKTLKIKRKSVSKIKTRRR